MGIAITSPGGRYDQLYLSNFALMRVRDELLRIEGVADPGGICISDDVFRQVQGRVAAEFVDIGERQLKNIARSVRIYDVKFDGG